MSLDLESRLRVFFASAPQTIHIIRTLEISHSAIATWHLWREPNAGSTFVGGVEHVMVPANFEAKLAGSPGHLDQVFNIRLGVVDREDQFHASLDLIPIDTQEKIKVIYREFLSDALDDVQATAVLQAESVSWAKRGGEYFRSLAAPQRDQDRRGLCAEGHPDVARLPLMDVNAYLEKQYSAQPCWELVADVYATELNQIPVDYKTVNRSIREMASAFRLAIHKSAHGFAQVAEPVDLCIVLLGKTEKIGIHHCGIYYQGSVLNAMTGSLTMYEELSVIRDRYQVVEFWARA